MYVGVDNEKKRSKVIFKNMEEEQLIRLVEKR